MKEFLDVVEELPRAVRLGDLREQFLALNCLEGTDVDSFHSPAFRNLVRNSTKNCIALPKRVRTFLQEVLDKMEPNMSKVSQRRDSMDPMLL